MLGKVLSLVALTLGAVSIGSPAQAQQRVCVNGQCTIQPGSAPAPLGAVYTFQDGRVGVWNAQLGAYVIQGVPKTVPPVGKVAAPAPAPAQDVTGFGIGDLRKAIVLDAMRTRAEFSLIRNGITRPDGGITKVTRSQARDLVGRVSDDTIFGGAKALGAPSTGGIQDFLKWCWDHKEEIVKFILSIVALFGDDIPAAHATPPDHVPVYLCCGYARRDDRFGLGA